MPPLNCGVARLCLKIETKDKKMPLFLSAFSLKIAFKKSLGVSIELSAPFKIN